MNYLSDVMAVLVLLLTAAFLFMQIREKRWTTRLTQLQTAAAEKAAEKTAESPASNVSTCDNHITDNEIQSARSARAARSWYWSAFRLVYFLMIMMLLTVCFLGYRGSEDELMKTLWLVGFIGSMNLGQTVRMAFD
jgi:Flp pilus assembly protein TadB